MIKARQITFMVAILANALLHGARKARDLLTPLMAPAISSYGHAGGLLAQGLEARIQAAREHHRTHRLPNTARNHAPKQKEWKTWYEGMPCRASLLAASTSRETGLIRGSYCASSRRRWPPVRRARAAG
jgi:hypothetical protein